MALLGMTSMVNANAILAQAAVHAWWQFVAGVGYSMQGDDRLKSGAVVSVSRWQELSPAQWVMYTRAMLRNNAREKLDAALGLIADGSDESICETRRLQIRENDQAPWEKPFPFRGDLFVHVERLALQLGAENVRVVRVVSVVIADSPVDGAPANERAESAEPVASPRP